MDAMCRRQPRIDDTVDIRVPLCDCVCVREREVCVIRVEVCTPRHALPPGSAGVFRGSGEVGRAPSSADPRTARQTTGCNTAVRRPFCARAAAGGVRSSCMLWNAQANRPDHVSDRMYQGSLD